MTKKSNTYILQRLWPYFRQYKARIFIALCALLLAKVASFVTPITLKNIVDSLSLSPQVNTLPLLLLIAYGAARFSVSLFNELRDLVFARVTHRTARLLARNVFSHLHDLSLRFHLARQMGGLTRDIERGSRAITSLTSYLLYSIVPTIVEIVLVMAYMLLYYDVRFFWITFTALVAYVLYTIFITNWRSHLRREMNILDTLANTRAVDALINFETVKYFDNAAFEGARYDKHLADWEKAALRSQTSLSILNAGQAMILVVAVVLVMWLAIKGVEKSEMSVGDLVLVNVFLLQLYIPLNFLGVLYREIKQGIVDLENLLSLLDSNSDVQDVNNAPALRLEKAAVTFENVGFYYDPDRRILHNVSFTIPPGQTLAIVGASGAGKSTIARLLFRFYDVTQGRILIDGQDLRSVQQRSLRQHIGVVPQDTVLFNDTIAYNICYGKPDCQREEMIDAAQKAALHNFIQSLPQGYDTLVGERGLKLSGGEKQRVALARIFLKNPPLIIFDEATAALDSHTEKFIQTQFFALAKNRTTVIIAHRLSTVVHADEIIVLDQGQIIERGDHARLLIQQGAYAKLWYKQQYQQKDKS